MTHATGGLPPDFTPAPTGAALDVQPPAATPTAPAAASSPLGDLRRHREERQKRLFVDLRVPGWGDDPDEDPRVSIYVRCRPVKPSELQDIRDTRQAAAKSTGKGRKNADWMDLAQADILIISCLEVWAWSGDPIDPRDLTDDDEQYRLSLHPDNLHGPKTKFDGHLADAIGMGRDPEGKPPRAVEIVRTLFAHDGDVMTAVDKLTRWSNLTNPRDDEDFTAG